MTAAPSGMLTRKIHCQEKALVSHPPSSGPIAAAPEMTAPQIPKVVSRSFPEGGVDCGQGRGQDQRPADSLDDPGADERASFLRQGGEQAAENEHEHPGNEEPAPADAVPEPSRGQQQGREHYGVEAVDPLGLGEVEFQVRDDGRQRDPDDGSVDDDHGQSGSQYGQGCPSFPGAGCRRFQMQGHICRFRISGVSWRW